jgi:hypothetical protein
MKDDSQQISIPTEQLESLCHRWKIRELSLFGSLFKGDFQSESDADLLVEFEPDATMGFMGLSALQREFSSIFGRPVDLVSKRGLNPVIRDEVLKQRRILYAS